MERRARIVRLLQQRAEYMTMASEPVRIAGRNLGQHRHVCALFDGHDEEYRVLLPFILDGLHGGERIVRGCAESHRAEQLRRLRDAGVDVDAARSSGQMELLNSEDTYLPDGDFDQERMLATIKQHLEKGAAEGFPRTRLMAHPECVFADWRHTNNFLQYEARLNQLLPRYRDTVVCVYDYTTFDAGIFMDILRTHPIVILGEVLHENPFFLPPDEFLQEVRSRSAPAQWPRPVTRKVRDAQTHPSPGSLELPA